jgi:hypothetical protein
MDNQFFEQPILNSPYEYPARHWELDEDGQPTQRIVESRRTARFIVVCNDTATSKLVYDYIAGYQREQADGRSQLQLGHFELFRNFDEYGSPLARPNTLPIDSQQLESGEALDQSFRQMAADEIERAVGSVVGSGAGRVVRG